MIYRMDRGESLFHVAQKHGITVEQLYKFNSELMAALGDDHFKWNFPIILQIPERTINANERGAELEFPIVCICGSMRFYGTMLLLAVQFTNQSYIVLMPFASKKDIMTRNESIRQIVEERLDTLHRAKIRMSSFIYVVDTGLGFPKTIPYIGQSTSNEINYAHELNIPVRFFSHEIMDKFA